jgi:thiamine biosynthesis lipoprotein
MEIDGRRYCHILDPRSGWPVQGVHSVSVVSESCLVAGALSTVAMLLGADDGEKMLQESEVAYLILTEDEGRIRERSSGLRTMGKYT